VAAVETNLGNAAHAPLHLKDRKADRFPLSSHALGGAARSTSRSGKPATDPPFRWRWVRFWLWPQKLGPSNLLLLLSNRTRAMITSTDGQALKHQPYGFPAQILN